MNSHFFIYTVVLWTWAESRHARRALEGQGGSVGPGSNLTHQQQQEVIHADVLQHFTATPVFTAQEVRRGAETGHDGASLTKDVPIIPEDINVQNLKNDDHLHVSFNRKITIDTDTQDAESPMEKNKTVKSNTNDATSYRYSQTGHSSSTTSEVLTLRSTVEHSSTSVVYDDEDSELKDPHDLDSVLSSTAETLKSQSVKNFDMKKKGKKEIHDSVTVPTDYGSARIEKPYKDISFSVKLKEKNKDSISEALDERRSTTIRNSDSGSISVSDSKPLGSVDIVKIDSPGTGNEESVNQNVNSVINANGVNSDSLKKLRAKYSIKRAHDVANDTEVDNSSASGNSLKEDVAKEIALEIQTAPPAEITSTDAERLGIRQHVPFRIPQLGDNSPTKLDIFAKSTTTPSSSTSTTIVKPSIAFKQQLANKLKGLEPSPTAPMIVSEDGLDEVQEKPFTKSSTKSSLRKKPKPDYHTSSSSETYIPPTATALTLVSLKPAADNIKYSIKPATSLDGSLTSTNNPSSTVRQTTVSPITRVKSFVPWSTRLLRSTTTTQPSTLSSEETKWGESANSEMASRTERTQVPEQAKLPESSFSLSTEDQSVIRTTQELDRNMSDTSDSIVQNTVNDFMVKDQSSTAASGTKNIVNRSTTEETTAVPNPAVVGVTSNSSGSDLQATMGERDNIIETMHISEESHNQNATDGKSLVGIKEGKPSNISSTMNEVAPASSNESEKDIKPGNMNLSSASTTSTTVSSILDIEKIKNLTEIEMDSVPGDMLDGAVDDGKSGEDSEEDEKLKQTTLPPVFEPFETTVITDLDEDIESENEREDEELPIIDKVNQMANDNSTMNNKTDIDLIPKPTNSALPEVNSTGTYVTSFDIISKENTTRVVTKTQAEGDINWYNVDVKQSKSSFETTTHKTGTVEVTTTADTATTTEPEPTTEVKEQETTFPPDTTEPVPTTAMPPRPTAPGSAEPTLTVAVEEGSELEAVDDPSACVRLIVLMSPLKLCLGQGQLRQSIANQLTTQEVSWQQVLIINRRLQDCEGRKLSEAEEQQDVDVCFVTKQQEPSPSIRDDFLRLYTKRAYDPSFPIVEVQMIVQPTAMTGGFDNVLAAIILSIIAAICLVLLGILLVIIRKRQGRFNYGQRCTPVSLDDYSLDNISVYNSVRRKGALRASKRSYGNPAFDDPSAPSHSVNFVGLANFSSDRQALDEEFSQVPAITAKADELPPGAESKNRYANVIPLPETRVPLQAKERGDPTGEYINANYIKGSKGQDKLYIACQAPLQSTVEDFWRMVWQQQTKVILMLTALNENGVEKCADYLPQLEINDCHRLFGDFQVTLKNHEVREKYIISSLQLKNLETNLWREVTHLWYSSWPSQGVPEDGSAMIAFLIEARSYTRGAQGPTVVHCSPGTGRTGTVIAIDLCIRDFETQRTVDIPKTVYALRRDRAGAVQTRDQYAFIYQVLNLYATKLTGGALDSI